MLSLEAYHRVRYVYRRVATRPELQYYLKQWRLKKYADFPVLYFALHGKPGLISLSERSADGEITLDWLGEQLASRPLCGAGDSLRGL